ncbi:hypothetical protein Y032_0153g2905 [Ancylostoma ceylanicum]|uniref:Uncharacterized protein n=1 Tax=Ancylostoma ceylanicum TaxID=53326 RepID=A0A016T090_9BILA|nr:hypothetical protein Y032_0153g2905 [Ancylostoma ceylanicum]
MTSLFSTRETASCLESVANPTVSSNPNTNKTERETATNRKLMINTKVILTLDRLLDVLEEWSTFKTWVLVWPLAMNVKSDVPKKLLTLSKKYLEEGGEIVTAWPPITSKNQSKWHGISDLWKSFDEALVKCDCVGQVVGQVVTIASNMWKHGKLFIEAGAPEGLTQYFNSYVGTALPKYIYEAIRKRAVGVQLPQLQMYVDRSPTWKGCLQAGRA